jgi:protoheme IX farnesyltransferase
MLAYTLALVICTLVFWPVAHLGPIYGVSAVVLGALFIWGGIDLVGNPTAKKSMRLFGFSISYVTLLFLGMAIDTVVRHGW